jgi:hypothetical protein
MRSDFDRNIDLVEFDRSLLYRFEASREAWLDDRDTALCDGDESVEDIHQASTIAR